MRIVMYCQFGVSTNILVSAIKEAGEKEDIVDAYPIGEFASTVEKYDIILMGPQVRGHAKRIKPLAEQLGIPFIIIDMMAYGRLDGVSIYETAKKELEHYRNSQTNHS